MTDDPDDLPDDLPDDVRAQLEADQFVFGMGFAEQTDGGGYRRLDPGEVTLRTGDAGEPTVRTPTETATAEEWTGEMKVTFDAEDTVECPKCGLQNPVPSRGVLQLVTRGPLPCRLCGHSLL